MQRLLGANDSHGILSDIRSAIVVGRKLGSFDSSYGGWNLSAWMSYRQSRHFLQTVNELELTLDLVREP